LGYTHLKAPETGTLATVDIEVNEYVQAGELVATLLAGEQIEVSVSVPASVIRSIRKGAEAKARFNSLEGKEFAGTVTEVGVASVGGATTFPVTVRLTEGQDQVRAGMSADVTFVFASEKEGPRYSLPISAVGEDREGRFVFILEKTGDALGTVHRTPVEVGEILSDGIEILDGVKPGDLVVTAGVSRIYDGLQVRVPERPGSEPDNVAGEPAPTTEANVTP
jgi:RND family efflux transporter MFP subunit